MGSAYKCARNNIGEACREVYLLSARGPFLRAYRRHHLFIITVATLLAEITALHVTLGDTYNNVEETRELERADKYNSSIHDSYM